MAYRPVSSRVMPHYYVQNYLLHISGESYEKTPSDKLCESMKIKLKLIYFTCI
jgi:hypothetical protein